MATLLEHCASQIDTLIAGGGALPLFSTLDHATPSYVRSATCWAASVDMTGVSAWNTGGAGAWAGTLLDTPSRRWIIGAKHAPPTGTLRFVTAAGVVLTRTVSASYTPGGDLWLGQLNEALPETIAAYKVLPANWQTYLLDQSLPPVLSSDHLKRALTGEWLVDASATVPVGSPLTASRLPYYVAPASGFSGSPVGLLINGVFVLLGCWGGPGSATSIVYWRDEIEAAIGETVGAVSLSGFDAVDAPAPTIVESVAAGYIGAGENWSTGSVPNWGIDRIVIKHAMFNAPGVWGGPVSLVINTPYAVIAAGGKFTTSSAANVTGSGKLTVYGELEIDGGSYAVATVIASGGIATMSTIVASSYAGLRILPGGRLKAFGADTEVITEAAEATGEAAQLATDQAAAPADQRTAATSLGGVVGTLDVDAAIDAAFATAKVRISKAQIVRGDA